MLSFGRSLMLVAALALPVTAGHFALTSVSAEAAGKKGARAAKVVKVGKVVRVKKVKKAKKGGAKKAAYKSCGTFMYWKGGKCNDARLKK